MLTHRFKLFTMNKSCLYATNAWDSIQELGKIIESYTRVKQGQREHFSSFLQRLAKAEKLGVTVPDARQVLIESMNFEKPT